MRQIAFLHRLATDKLESYQKELQRKGYPVSSGSPLFIAYDNERKVAKLRKKRIHTIFTDASLKSWNNLEEKRFSPHDFRDFLQSKLEIAGINSNMISPFLTHKVRGTDFHYSNHDVEELKEKFRRALPYLIPESIEEFKAKCKAEGEKTQRELKSMKECMEKLQPLL